jgi:hypothetical protein
MPLAKRLRAPWMENAWRSDLQVPDYIEKDASIRRKPWYQQCHRARRPSLVLVIPSGPGCYALVFPRQR